MRRDDPFDALIDAVDEPPTPATLVTEDGARFVGTLVGESTSREFRIALAQEAVREQDIVSVEAEMRSTANPKEREHLVVWAKVQRIERLNPLFPVEAGHELAATGTSPLDTVLSLSREMVTAVCQVLGSERRENPTGKLDHLRYPAQPATQVRRPASGDIARIVLGDMRDERKKRRAVDLATLANRPEVNVVVDGHAIVSRHLAILAMTGAGKSVTARRIIEEISKKGYPIVIFDPHGDYAGLKDLPAFARKAISYHAAFPILELDGDDVMKLVGNLGYELSPTMQGAFSDLFRCAVAFGEADEKEWSERCAWLTQAVGDQAVRFGIARDLWLVRHLAEAAEAAYRDPAQPWVPNLQALWPEPISQNKRQSGTLEALKKRCASAAKALRRMETTNRKVAGDSEPLPTDRTALVGYDRVSVISLAGYTGDMQATLFSLVAGSVFEARVTDELKLPVLFVLEEAHNFAPAKATTPAEAQAVEMVRQIAQEGRKFGVGLVMISQRPSRLDETALSQCNSYVIMRMVNPADQNYIRRVIESLGEDEAKLLPDLDVGEALLSGQMINFPVLAKIKEPLSKGAKEEEDAFDALDKARAALAEEARRPPGGYRRP